MPSPKNNPTRLLLSLAGGLGVLALGFWLAHRQTGRDVHGEAPPATPPPEATSVKNTPVTAAVPSAVSNSRLQAACDVVRTASNAKTVRPQLAELRGALSAMPTDAAVTAVRHILDSKVDARTYLGFKVAGNGLLDEAP